MCWYIYIYTVNPIIQGRTRDAYVVPPPGANWVQDGKIFTKHKLKAMNIAELSQSPFFEFSPLGLHKGYNLFELFTCGIQKTQIDVPNKDEMKGTNLQKQ